MRRQFLALVLAVLVSVGLGGIAYAQNVSGSENNATETSVATAATPVIRSLTFTKASDVFKFNVTAKGRGNLTVDTQDCCIVGDKWGVEVTRTKKAPKETKDACGTGSTSGFSGAVTSTKFNKGTVEVSYCSGTDQFPAGMSVRFQHTGKSLKVTGP